MKKSIFITRDLSSSSPLHQLGKQYRIQGYSLLDFHTISVDPLPACDWIFFYSQQGVVHFSKQAKVPKSVKVAAFGARTGIKCQNVGMSVQFIGDGKAETTSRGLALVTRNQTILFITAQTSLRSVQKILGDKPSIIETVVYANLPKEQINVSHADILIFTSPLNAKTYFSGHSLQRDQQVIAIGQTTATALAKLGITQVRVPNEASEDSMVTLINSFDF